MTPEQYAALVRAQVGDRYILGAEASASNPDPSVFDCSELVEWSYARAGVTITDGAWLQYNATVPISGLPEIGDLVFLRNNPDRPNGIGHVGIYVGGNRVVEAKGRDYGVVEVSYNTWLAKSTFAGTRRYPAFTQAMQGGEEVGYYTLSKGATGALVGELQERLRITGADMRTVTGNVFDEVTEQLVRNFQTANGLGVDGVVGKDTWTKLISVTTALPIVVTPAPVHVCQPPADYSALKTKAALVDDFIKSVSAVKVVS